MRLKRFLIYKFLKMYFLKITVQLFVELFLVFIENKYFNSFEKEGRHQYQYLRKKCKIFRQLLRGLVKDLKTYFIYTKIVENKYFPTIKSNLFLRDSLNQC